jgi:hypothetical protein
MISKHFWLILIEITQSPMASILRILIRYRWNCVLKYTTHQMHLNWMKLPTIKELCHIHPYKFALLSNKWNVKHVKMNIHPQTYGLLFLIIWQGLFSVQASLQHVTTQHNSTWEQKWKLSKGKVRRKSVKSGECVGGVYT